MGSFDDENPMPIELTTFPMGKIDPKKPKGKKSLGSGMDPYSGNVYYQWFCYMKAYPAYRQLIVRQAERHSLHEEKGLRKLFRWAEQTSKVEVLFDVSPDESFQDWWERKADDLFYDWYEETSHAVEIDCRRGNDHCEDGVCVFLPLDGNITDMLNEVERIFLKRRAESEELCAEMDRKFAIHQDRYTVASLHNMLVTFEAVAAKIDDVVTERVTLYEIFFEIAPQLVLGRSLRHIDNNTASRRTGERFAQACCLLFNVGQGRFPDFSIPTLADGKTQPAYDPRDFAKFAGLD